MSGQSARQAFTIFFACLLAVSMMVSPFLLSISMWGLVAAAFWEGAVVCRKNGLASDLRQVSAWWKILVWSFQNLFRQRHLALLVLLLLVPAASFFWSENHGYWLERVQTRLPFLVLPWAFANLPRLSERQLRLVIYVFIWALTLICIGATVNFALHFDEIMVGIGEGRPMPVPRNHIRFSLMIATGILAGGWLWVQGFYWQWKWERRALAAAVIFLFAFIHLLSVRSGIAGLYVALLFSLGWFVWQTRRWGIGLIALVFIVLAPFAAMEAIPSLKMKFRYMHWDWLQFQQNIGGEYSDAQRLVSLQAGIQLWRENPVLGVGTGDLPDEVKRVISERYPNYAETPKLPHNQFIYILASTGLLGLALSLVAFFAPIAVRRYRLFYLFAVFQVLIFTSFLVEYTIETAMGVAFYLFFTLWFMKIKV